MICTPAFACVPFQYVSAVAQGKVRTSRGDWATYSMETDRSLVRIEYTSSGPTRRYAIVGNLDEGWGYGFPVGSVQPPLRKVARTSLQRLLDQAGLPGWAFAQAAYSSDPVKIYQGMKCRLTSISVDWPLRAEKDAHVCLHDVANGFAGGLPLFAEGAHGNRVLEVQKIELRRVPLERFNPPRPNNGPMIVARRTPTTCSG